METRHVKHERGFTLIEMLLVMVIASTIIYMAVTYVQQKSQQMMIDKTTLQIEQILNAAMAYYVSNGEWPAQPTGAVGNNNGLPCLLATAGYGSKCQTPYLISNQLPASNFITPYGTGYLTWVNPAPNSNLFYVIAPISAGKASATTANIIAGRLPMSFTTSSVGNTSLPCTVGANATCFVYSAINIPGQNLNNASAVNYAGLYHNGACVPTPSCPKAPDGSSMTPQIMVVPVSVSGTSDVVNQSSLYPLESFTAYATGPVAATAGGGPPKCTTNSGANNLCYSDAQGGTQIKDGNNYWRVCLQVVTQQGVANWGADTNSANWGRNATVLAITRCAISNEPTGSGFNVWAP